MSLPTSFHTLLEARLTERTVGAVYADQVLLPVLRESGLCIDQECWPADLNLTTAEPAP